MKTQIFRVDPVNPQVEILAEAAGVLRSGGLVAFPTETVYGLGGNALSPQAVDKVYRVKGRPKDNPLIVHVADRETVLTLAREVSPLASKLMDVFWPGPLTLLFPRGPGAPEDVSAGLPSVAIRMPDHPVARQLIRLAGVPLVAPSANISGRPSPTTWEEVCADLCGKVDVIIDGGPTGIGVESTVLDLEGPVPVVLREGAVTAEQLSEVIGTLKLSPPDGTDRYVLDTEMKLVQGDCQEIRESITLYAFRLLSGEVSSLAILSCSENIPFYKPLIESFESRVYLVDVGPRANVAQVAGNLFKNLRYADGLGAGVILAELFPPEGLGRAVNSRLLAASGQKTLPLREKGPLNVLMVCTGNTCRSPMAQGLFENAWRELGNPCPLKVFSRGTAAAQGSPATRQAQEALRKMGIDIKGHRSAQVSWEDLRKADLAVTMTEAHRTALAGRFPEFSGKIKALFRWVPDAVKGDVADPFGLGQQDYDRTAFLLEGATRALARKLADVWCRQTGEENTQ